MVKHVVLFTFRESFTLAEIENLFKSIGELKKVIPQIKTYSYGKNNSLEELNRDFEYGMVMDFDTEEDRDFYMHHDEHLRVVKELIIPSLKDITSSVLVLDYKY